MAQKIQVIDNLGRLSVAGQLTNTNGFNIGIDTTTRTLQTIEYEHHEIHSGSHFFLTGFIELGAGGISRIKIVTPNTDKWAHILWAVDSTNITEMMFYEGASDGMLGGTSLTPVNNDRNAIGTSPFLFTNGISAASDNGTLIEATKWGAANVRVQIGGGTGRSDEIILKQNETYLGVLTSSNADNTIQFKFTWYEHTNKTN